ncbi:hypothetical protein [Streptomyces sp. NPDC058451]|uniref:hypothetical protein n=1 Tax=Streptomyces sp. NPDC058451 TaxID=3346506 RepID=UPI00364F7122
MWGRPGRDAEGALTVLAWAGCFCRAVCHTGLDPVAGISAGTAAGGDVHGVVGRLFAAGDRMGRAGVYALTVAALATCAVLLRRHGLRAPPGAAVVSAACWSFVDSHMLWPRGVSIMLGFAVGHGLPAPAASQPDDARSAAGGLTNP